MNKIALFLPSLEGGGAERVAVTLAGGFLERGYAVDIVLAEAKGALLASVPPSARVVDLKVHRTLAALPGLTTYLRREKPVALIAAPDVANLVALWAKLLSLRRTKMMISNHSNLSSLIKYSPKLQEKIYPSLLRIFSPFADAVMAVSNGAADELAKLAGIPRERIVVIHNPIPASKIAALSTEPLDHPWFASRQPPIILTVGRLGIEKDYPTLLQAFALVRSRRSVRLIILGEGKQREELMALAKHLGIDDDVNMPGFEQNPYSFMARCSVFVLSSIYEGFPNVLAEALACCAQIVSTDCPSGPAEILEKGKYGRLVPVGDPQALAIAIEDALAYPLPAEMLRGRARAFSVEAATEEYLHALGLE